MCALATPALAEDFHLSEKDGLSFERRALVPVADADLSVANNVVYARNGVRKERGREQFSSSLALSLGDVLRVKNAQGKIERLRVESVRNGIAHLNWYDGNGQIGKNLRGDYRNTRVLFGGDLAQPSYGNLTFSADARYNFGQSRGSWENSEGRLVLSTLIASWGAPAVLAGGDVLIFRFIRGATWCEVRFERADTSSEPLAEL